MEWSLIFFLNSIMLGVGLAMDAFSVSLANGLEEPDMRPAKMCGIAAVFGIFQALMPLAGWTCVHTVVKIFNSFSSIVPWIALILLGYIGVKMLLEGIKNKNGSGDQPQKKLTVSILFFQGIATSIDALYGRAGAGKTFWCSTFGQSLGSWRSYTYCNRRGDFYYRNFLIHI